MKRVLAILFATIIVGQVWAADYDFKSEKLCYKIVDQNTVRLVGNDTYSKEFISVIIPEIVTYKKKNYKVVEIADCAFLNCAKLESVSIPNSLINIGEKAFKGCKNLKKAEFASIESLCQIEFNDNPLFYAHHLYINGKEITDLTIPNGVTSISTGAFCGCSNITSVTIPRSVTSIGAIAFARCTNLISVTIPESVTSIGAAAFEDCANLKSVTIPNSVSEICARTFRKCTNLEPVSIPNSVTSIGRAAFCSCLSFTQVKIPASVKIIEENAFANCPNLKEVYCDVSKKPAGWDTYWISDTELNKTFTRTEIIKWKESIETSISEIDQISERYEMVLVGRWKYYSARIYVDNDDEFYLSISLHDDIKWPLDGKYLMVLGKDYASFEKNMAIVNEKFAKWTQTAKTDGVKNFRKTIVDFGDRIGHMSMFEFRGGTKLYAVFEVDENGSCLLKLGSQEIDDSRYAYSNYEPYYTFNSPEKFRKFYEIIKYDNAMKNYGILKSKINAKKKAIEDRDAKFD